MEVFVVLIFLAGYAAIALEHPIKINKAASALLTGVLCWTLFTFSDSAVAEGNQIQFIKSEKNAKFYYHK